ncbi:uncharacterized protein F5Z01DRAFT_752771 [Emericellopsis atlantica]|uniref:Zn(2)-C6 fungal-type domain-containing protein n=1 Tax=Emericellopsis atlantica TaxID=2614577 RepID=A0A9P8CLT8_9HYPO|nr:uncharacterized protein F5Z01DRAFT_752771 [Emericellopsis atlantica]KAG9251355.1 hypothetical protein F5Z01DRAFT_752771 [Emericellopsis atlantica]
MRSGKTPVSCIPCAKRKVRCDKQQPCCHCKRRPQDACEYPRPIAVPERGLDALGERIVHLERVIRSLGGDPNDLNAVQGLQPQHGQTPSYPSPASVESARSSATARIEPSSCETTTTAAIDRAGLLAHDEEATYVESPMWYSWGEAKFLQHDNPAVSSLRHQLCLSPSSGSGYVSTILDPIEVPDRARSDTRRVPRHHFDTLWTIFLQNVHPLVKIFFDWEVEPVIERAKQEEASDLSAPEEALLSAISFLATVSLPEDDCVRLLHEEKPLLLAHLHHTTEVSLRLAGYAVTSNKLTVQAFMLYLHAIRARAHPAALFSLMGVASRVAERMGLHRDGEILGLSVLRSEERRRMWWQLQYMELTVAHQVGALSPSVLGKWDAKMPANVDDSELGPETKALPADGTALTSMSNCLWKYSVLHLHRGARGADRGVPTADETTSMVDRIEEMLRVKFVQHCELLNPLHVNMQVAICQVLVATRRLLRQPALIHAKISDMSRRERDALLAICVKNLEYCILTQTNETLKGFKWHNNAFFPWAAFIYVILEANHRAEEATIEDIWRTIRRTYETHDELRVAAHRQDVTFAARITASAWQRRQLYWQKQDASSRREETPSWIMDVCKTFNLPQPGSVTTAGEQGPHDATEAPALDFDLDLDMIDWSVWDGAAMDAALFSNAT